MTETPEIDPVCKMKVLPSRAAAEYELNGKKYYFCNPGCKTKFQNYPEKYLFPDSESDTSRDSDVRAANVQIRRVADAVDSRALANVSPPAMRRPALQNEHLYSDHAHLDRLEQAHANHDHLNHGQPLLPANDLRSFYLPASAFEYSCPMDPEVRQSQPGSCPKCGMLLEAAIKSGDEQEASQEYNDLRNRLIPAALLTVILLLISMPSMLGLRLILLPPGSMQWIQLLLASPVVLWCGQPIFKKAFDSAKAGHMNMFTLIAFGVSISYIVSILFMTHLSALISGSNGHGSMLMSDMLYFESAASIITLVLIGQLIELKARESSNKSMQDLFRMAPAKARREISPNKTEDVPVMELKPGDRLRVLPGDQIPVDGKIIEGSTSIDESLLTGNALPITKTSGQNVYTGTINGDGSILIMAEALGRETVFAQIANLLAGAQSSRSRMQDIADRVSAVFIPSVLVIALLTFVAWYMAGELPHAVQDAVAVLVIACPCALGLATPLAVSQAVARAARLGLMVKDARALENLASANSLFIDKTGTLTRGTFELVAMITRDGLDQNHVLQQLAALERASTHPLARAVVRAAEEKGLAQLTASELKSFPGLGLKAIVDGVETIAGNIEFMQEQKIDVTAIKIPNEPNFKGASRIYAASGGELQAVLSLKDKLKPEAAEFISQLRHLGISPEILTGDADWSISGTADELQLSASSIHCNLKPQNKVELIKKAHSENQIIAMLGDGVNDAAALAVADAGIAMSSGSDVAVHSAPITINGSDLRVAVSGIKLGRLMQATMKQNLFLAFAYNIVALVFASGALYSSTGIELSPTIAAGAMSLSSLSVIINSLRIRAAKI